METLGWVVTPRPEKRSVSKYGGMWDEADWHTLYTANFAANIPQVGRPVPVVDAWGNRERSSITNESRKNGLDGGR